MAEERKTRSKQTSSKTKHTKDANSESPREWISKKPLEVDDKENVFEKSAGKRERRSKKRKIEEGTVEGTPRALNGDKEEHKKKKKKNVSFSAETKETDPQDDSEEEEAKSQSPEQEENAEQADDEDGDANKKEKKKKQKEKRKKSENASTNESTNDDSTAEQKSSESPTLSYLSTYHNDRASWKFQKIRETQLFKHILSLECIPAKYDTALLSYLQGLRGEAAKQRLRDVAQAAIKTDTEETKPDTNTEISEPTDGAASSPFVDYRKAIYAFRTKLAEGNLPEDLGETYEQLAADVKKRFSKRQRAETILYAVDGKVFTMSNLKAPPQKGKNATQNQPTNKKKKNRTAFIEISSSSESDSGSDDVKKRSSPKKNNPAQSQPEKKKKKTARTAVVEMSSSSSESVGDSDSSPSSSSS
ncbi:hypothetical protein BJY00DRAFT_277393 [Aspergillus carlsbadensis]|nr:hypothetical protein BJY00DRAFT_277393 [Aspergillus carlsbadensis]